MEIGRHCAHSPCHRLDFLPFTCDQCHKLFCKDHRLPDQHSCTCDDETPLKKTPYPKESTTSVRSVLCSLDGCKRRQTIEVICPHCNGVFCLHHRHQVNHSCPALPAPRSKEVVTDNRTLKLGKTSPAQGGSCTGGTGSCTGGTGSCTGGTGSGSSKRRMRLDSTRAKVMLMKLKMEAKGCDAIPMSERVYCQVELPPESGLTCKPMFFSREWSVGKTVDYIAQRFKLRNDNNLPQSTQQLVLHNVEGETMTMSLPLHSELDTCSLPSGSVTLILKYV